MLIKAIEWAATIGTVFALYLLSENNSFGFVLGMFSNLAWLAWAHAKNAGGILAVNAIMIFINLNGLGII